MKKNVWDLDLQPSTPRPGMKSLFQAISAIIHSQILEAQSFQMENTRNRTTSFNPERFKLEKTDSIDTNKILSVLEKVPTVDDIYHFIKGLYDYAKFSAECFVIFLIYIDRLVSISSVQLLPNNWRSIILSSLLISQEVWNFRDFSNIDLTSVCSILKAEKILRLSEKFLDLLQHKIFIKASLYTKYYFRLKDLFKIKSDFPFRPLDVTSAQDFEDRADQVRKSKLLKKAMQSIFTVNSETENSENNSSGSEHLDEDEDFIEIENNLVPVKLNFE